jgi:hypothetical protein
MKKVLFLSVFIFNSFFIQAQNNLQFNRVVIVEADSLFNCNSNCGDTFLLKNFTVPAGKALKIESINIQGSSTNFRLCLNKTPFSPTSTNYTNVFPIWLPAGEHKLYFFYRENGNLSITGRYSYLMSALEFNIVQ